MSSHPFVPPDRSWVRASRAELDRPLADAVVDWLTAAWPWSRVDYQGR